MYAEYITIEWEPYGDMYLMRAEHPLGSFLPGSEILEDLQEAGFEVETQEEETQEEPELPF